jgi:hypothetical protein
MNDGKGSFAIGKNLGAPTASVIVRKQNLGLTPSHAVILTSGYGNNVIVVRLVRSSRKKSTDDRTVLHSPQDRFARIGIK